MARKSFTEHPEFMTAGGIANALLQTGVSRMGCDPSDLDNLEEHANRVVDDMTRLLLKALDARQRRNRQAA